MYILNTWSSYTSDLLFFLSFQDLIQECILCVDYMIQLANIVNINLVLVVIGLKRPFRKRQYTGLYMQQVFSLSSWNFTKSAGKF